MKQTLALLFLAGSSIVSALPSLVPQSMDMGTATDTLATNQKTTAIQIKNEVLPKIERNFNLTKLVAEREYKETSQLYKYIDDSIAHATSAIIKTINDMKKNTDESISILEKNMKDNLVSLKTTTKENNEKILQSTVNSNSSALALSLDWLNKRMVAAEGVLASRVGVCGVASQKQEPGPVGYDQILHHSEGDKKMRLAGKDLEVGDVFDKTRGLFTVPAGGSGEYSISVGMVMKVFDWQFQWGTPQNVLSKYVVYVGDRRLDEALLASDSGASENADLIQASRTISVHLVEGQMVKLVKDNTKNTHAPSASTDHMLTFCVSMEHLDSALSLDDDKTRAPRPSVPTPDLRKWTFAEPSLSTIAPPSEIEPMSSPTRLPKLVIETTAGTTIRPRVCVPDAFHNCD